MEILKKEEKAVVLVINVSTQADLSVLRENVRFVQQKDNHVVTNPKANRNVALVNVLSEEVFLEPLVFALMLLMIQLSKVPS